MKAVGFAAAQTRRAHTLQLDNLRAKLEKVDDEFGSKGTLRSAGLVAIIFFYFADEVYTLPDDVEALRTSTFCVRTSAPVLT